MIDNIKKILSDLYQLYKSCMEEEKNNFESCITNIFEGVGEIEENYTDILTTLRFNIIYGDWKGDDSLKYLYNLEYALKKERIYIREKVKNINKMYNQKVERFINGVFGIMYCERVDRFRIKEMEHRFSRLIRFAKSYNESYRFKLDFLEEINDMLEEINWSWKVVCREYSYLITNSGKKLKLI